MKTSEFIEKVEALEFVDKIDKGDLFLGIRSKNSFLCMVGREEKYLIDNNFNQLQYLGDLERSQLMSLVWEYAKTPIEERKDKTIEEKVGEYIKGYVSDHLSFESARDFLESVDMYFNNKDENRKYLINSHLSHYTKEALEEYFEVYHWYRNNSNEFVKLWCEVSADE